MKSADRPWPVFTFLTLIHGRNNIVPKSSVTSVQYCNQGPRFGEFCACYKETCIACMGHSHSSIHKLRGWPPPNTQSAFRAKPPQSHRSTLEKGRREGRHPCDVNSFERCRFPGFSIHGRERTLGTTWDPSLPGRENHGNEVVWGVYTIKGAVKVALFHISLTFE